MKIIKNLSDAVVVFAGAALTLADSGASNGDWTAPTVTPDNAVLVDVEALPNDFVGGHYTYAGGVFTRTQVGLEAAQAAQAQFIADFTATVSEAVQKRLDDFALTREYDHILSACTYATSAVPKFAAEGQYCVQARDATFAALYQIRADVLAGQRPIPTPEELLSELPPLVWPEVPA